MGGSTWLGTLRIATEDAWTTKRKNKEKENRRGKPHAKTIACLEKKRAGVVVGGGKANRIEVHRGVVLVDSHHGKRDRRPRVAVIFQIVHPDQKGNLEQKSRGRGGGLSARTRAKS